MKMHDQTAGAIFGTPVTCKPFNVYWWWFFAGLMPGG